MRYRITDGVVKYFKNIFDNVVYVQNVDDAFMEFEKLKPNKPEFKKAPAVIAISRTGSRIADNFMKPQEQFRGRLNRRNGDKNDIVQTLDCSIMYDITVIAYDNLVMDTLVDELIFRILKVPTFRYDSGVTSVNDGVSPMINEAQLIYEGNELGMLEETVSIEKGRVHRTTFSISVDGEIYMTSQSSYLAKEVPLTLDVTNTVE